MLSFENNGERASYKRCYLPKLEIKDYKVLIYGQKFFDQPIKNNLRACDNIWENTAGWGDDYTTGCLLDYLYFKNYCKMIAIDLSWKQVLDADPRTKQLINFTANLDRRGNVTTSFII